MNPTKRSLRTALKMATLMACVVLLGGCGMSKPVLSPMGWGSESRAELEHWAERELEIAIEATGVGEEGWWLGTGEPTYFWDANREELFENAYRGECHVKRGEPLRPGQLQIDVWHLGSEASFEIAELVRERWVADGWTVRDVGSPEILPEMEVPKVYFRADREGERGWLVFVATAYRLMIEANTDCSVDASMSW